MRKIGIIGLGNMGAAIAERIKCKYRVFVFDKDSHKTKGLNQINVTGDCASLLHSCQVLILAVKPQDFPYLLNEIKSHVEDKLIISIAAGITTRYIEQALGKVKVIRLMPNLAVKIGEGMSCACKGRYALKKELNFALKIFRHLGVTLVIKEEKMNAATALCGSGPAFIYYFLEKKVKKDLVVLFSAAVNKYIGVKPEGAKEIAQAIIKGSISLLKKTKLSPRELKEKVASKGGTTEAGLAVLAKGGTLDAAISAAIIRAEELCKKE